MHKCLVNIQNEQGTLNSIKKRTTKDYNKREYHEPIYKFL
jgi:hypothetical protein